VWLGLGPFARYWETLIEVDFFGKTTKEVFETEVAAITNYLDRSNLANAYVSGSVSVRAIIAWSFSSAVEPNSS
jgi:hypothetical protein